MTHSTRFFSTILSIMFYSLLLLSCSKDDDGVSLIVENPDGTSFDGAGGKKTLVIKGDATWTFNISDDWLTCITRNGKEQKGIELTAAPNPEFTTRTSTLSINCVEDASQSKSIVFTQEPPAPTLKVSPDTITRMPLYNNNATINIESNANWTITSDADWVQTAEKNGKGKKTVTVTLADNADNSQREAVLTVLTVEGQLSTQVRVIQKGMDAFLYRAPFMGWESSLEEIKDYMNGYDIYQESNNSIIFLGKYKEALTAYNYISNRLTRSTVALFTGMAMVEDLTEYLQYYGFKSNGMVNGSYPRFTAADDKTLAIIDEDLEEGIAVRYYDYVHLYQEPYTTWHNSRAIVKAAVDKRGYTILDEGFWQGGGFYTAYYGGNAESWVAYYFNLSNQLQQVVIAINPTIADFKRVCNYYKSSLNYEELGSEVGEYAFLSRNRNSVVLVQNTNSSSDQIMVGYLSYKDVMANARKQTRSMSPLESLHDLFKPLQRNIPNNSDIPGRELK